MSDEYPPCFGQAYPTAACIACQVAEKCWIITSALIAEAEERDMARWERNHQLNRYEEEDDAAL